MFSSNKIFLTISILIITITISGCVNQNSGAWPNIGGAKLNPADCSPQSGIGLEVILVGDPGKIYHKEDYLSYQLYLLNYNTSYVYIPMEDNITSTTYIWKEGWRGKQSLGGGGGLFFGIPGCRKIDFGSGTQRIDYLPILQAHQENVSGTYYIQHAMTYGGKTVESNIESFTIVWDQ